MEDSVMKETQGGISEESGTVEAAHNGHLKTYNSKDYQSRDCLVVYAIVVDLQSIYICDAEQE
jgi:hypothetical protein